MHRLPSFFLAVLLSVVSLAAYADRDARIRDRIGERHFGHRFDHADPGFRARRAPRFDERHFDSQAHFGRDPWRGHRGWQDFGSRRFDQFHPGSRAFDRRAPLDAPAPRPGAMGHRHPGRR
ncbi:MAG: hypothetical protein DIU74_003760 [Pseudomonadota bacterium]|mgnify:FL=1|nr:MAG: hypothetical protein DIU74_12185 [Pseudomonadota bacterium]